LGAKGTTGVIVDNAIGILGTGRYLPPHRLSNQDLIDRYLLDTTDEWVIARTGIRERRVVGPEESTSGLGLRAGRRALANAGITPDQVGAILVATSSPDMLQPPTACLIQGRLGAARAFACDVAAVCSGFLYAMVMGAGLLSLDPALDYVLVIGAEAYSRILDYSDRSTCFFFGDGAGAVVLGRTSSAGILSYALGADGSRSPIMGMPAGGTAAPAHAVTVAYGLHHFRMAGRQVWDFVSDVLPRIVESLLEQASLNVGDIDLFIPHQANAKLLKHAFATAGVPEERIFINLAHHANTAAASVPIALAEAAEAEMLQPGSRVLLVAFGGGLTWGGMVLEWSAQGDGRR
jgi:3-oxoacyl-[acyl-carrier-protein] synthase-3